MRNSTHFASPNARRGSVLILVIVLVVLLALMGTALLSTTRSDRYVSTQNIANTQIDLLMDGVQQMVKGTITHDLYGHFDNTPNGIGTLKYDGFRLPDDSSAFGAGTFTYRNWDAPLLIDATVNPLVPPARVASTETEVLLDFQARNRMLRIANNTWLSPRLPQIWMNSVDVASSTDVAIGWSALSRLPGVDHFDTPFATQGTGANHSGAPVLTLPLTYTQRLSEPLDPTNQNSRMHRFVPNYLQLDPTGPFYPAWYLPPDNTAAIPGRYVLAGDADGDGIADSGMVKLGEYDGVTYYYCTRIVDNNSAINVNTAWSQFADHDYSYNPVDGLGQALTGTFTTAGAGNLGMFRSHVGLLELLYPTVGPALPKEAQALFEYRASYPLNGSTIQPNTPYDDSTPTPAAFLGFNFTTIGEQWESQLARRLENPGYYAAAGRMQRFGLSDSAALAYHGLFNSMDVSMSPLESTFYNFANTGTLDSIVKGSAPDRVDTTWTTPNARNRRSYPVNTGPKAIERWFDDNFYFEGYPGSPTISPVGGDPANGAFAINLTNDPFGSGNRWRSPRSILVSDNPVSNLIPKRYVDPTVTPKVLPVDDPSKTGTNPGMPYYRPSATTGYPNGAPAKTNINTASFDELWRAFWCVMAENTPSGTPFSNATHPKASPGTIATDPGGVYWGMQYDTTEGGPFSADPTPANRNQFRMFRSMVRDWRPGASTPLYLENSDMVLYRSAAAAVQTIQMRDNGYTVNSVAPFPQYYKDIPLPVQNQPGGPVTFRVWGTAPQPFITEVFIWTGLFFQDPASGMKIQNTAPYISVELYNPYAVPIVLDAQWFIAWTNRSGATYGNSTPMTLTSVSSFASLGTPTIAPGGYLLLVNSGQTAPPSAQAGIVPAGTQTIQVSGLNAILGNEMILVHENVSGAMTNPGLAKELVPIDSFDTTGMQNHLAPGSHRAWHYVRPCGGGVNRQWQCVYPGRYWGDQTDLRQQGTDWVNVHLTQFGPPTDPEIDDWIGGISAPVCLPTPGGDNPLGTMPATIAIQLNNLDSPGPNRITGASGNKYPFGAFMRSGDILQVPFIAACTIVDSAGTLIDLNSISMDASFAEDSDPDDDYARHISGDNRPIDPDFLCQREQVGRFCPLRIRLDQNTPPSNDDQTLVDDFNDGGTYDLNPSSPILGQPKWHYRWAMDLFDYLTVESPGTDYLPNVPPVAYTLPTPTASLIKPRPADNSGSGNPGEEYIPPGVTTPPGYNAANVGKEDALGVHGLININTAPWKVLAAIPWLPKNLDVFAFEDDSNGNMTFDYKGPGQGNGVPDNEDIARAIVYWRDGDPTRLNAPPSGPFRSIFDLYKIHLPASTRHGFYVFDEIQRGLMTQNLAAPPTKDIDDSDGDFSPLGDGTLNPNFLDHSHFDFEEMYLSMTKVSNLITTRSDSFTVYIQLQGWRGVGTTNPQMVVQRRAAFIQDRSQMTETNKVLPPSVNVANE